MTHSMTGFARSAQQDAQFEVTWECRSVNHRYLEVQFRIPDALRAHEHELKELVRKYIKRGKLDLAFKYSVKQKADSEFSLNANLVHQLFNLQSILQSHQKNLSELSAADILRFPGVLVEAEQSLESLETLAKASLEEGLKALAKARASEGQRIGQFISDRLVQINEHVKGLRESIPEISQQLKEKTLAKLNELQVKPDQDRFEQEMVYLLQKMDVDEELDRLDSHIKEVEKTLALAEKGQAVGRRLDFLMQEFNREANTLASKSQAASTTNSAVDLKVLIEQMREQIQNIE